MHPTSTIDQKNVIIAALVILAVIIGALVIFRSLKRSDLPTDSLVNAEINFGERKQEIVSMVYEKEALTETEKRSIIRDISGEDFSKYEFSEEEKIRLIRALNN